MLTFLSPGREQTTSSSVFKKGKLSRKNEIMSLFFIFVMHFSNEMFIIDEFIMYIEYCEISLYIT